MNNNLMFSHNSDEWSTPLDFFSKLNNEFHFTLDPCSSLLNHKCDKFYTLEDDGLSFSWAGECVFVNPPYSNVIAWVKKSYYEFLKDMSTTIVLLLPARTDTKWFHEYCYPFAKIRFIKGRLKFGDSKYNAPFPSMLVIFQNS